MRLAIQIDQESAIRFRMDPVLILLRPFCAPRQFEIRRDTFQISWTTQQHFAPPSFQCPNLTNIDPNPEHHVKSTGRQEGKQESAYQDPEGEEGREARQEGQQTRLIR